MSYRILPFGAKRIRAVRKEKKLYFLDWSRVESPGARFENMVAGHLLKWGMPFAAFCRDLALP